MSQQAFDPNQYVSKVKGRDYLEVKWRIAWMRTDHPDAILETDLASHEDGRAIMRARVTFPNGASATGWGSETVNAFENYIEKAETKAIGRALTALGYGTPVSMEAPMQEPSRPRAMVGQQSNAFLATPPQKSRIQRLAAEANLDEASLESLIHEHTGESLSSINKRQASGIIDLLESRRMAPQRAS